MKPIFKTLSMILLTLLIVTGSVWIYLRTSLPKTVGAVSLDSLNGQVEIVRDDDGVPHIFASTDHDAFIALGYVHAQDRMWQMEMQRRIGSGRLSEVLGETTLETDKFLRTLGTYRAAHTAWPDLITEVKVAIEAYTAGVNAWISEGHTLPVEYLILGFKPEPWTVYDSLAWSKMMMWDLGGNWDDELLRALVIQAVGAQRAEQLLPGYPQDALTTLSSHHIVPDTAYSLLTHNEYLYKSLKLGSLDAGSNNWAIGGSRTESGLPMLANDPHLGANIPSIWYLVEIQGDVLHVTGATLPGVPIVLIGHNDHIAWGTTNLGPDVQDLYIERINPVNPNQYEFRGKWEDMTIVEEPIVIKDEDDPIPYAARSTRHGPLISDVLQRAGTPLALRWTALDPGDTTATAFFKVSYATNWQQFTTALQHYVAPSQNFVYADIQGNIGYYGPGHIPIRAQGDGTVPVPGWDGTHEWLGWIPFEDLPHVFNPEEDYIVTANNKVVPEDYPYFITHDWAPPYRAKRIAVLINDLSDRGNSISIEDMALIQGDQISLQAQEMLALLGGLRPENERQEAALAYLDSWDLEMSSDGIAPSIYSAWFVQLGRVLLEDDLHGDLYEQLANRKHPTFLANVLIEQTNPWCDNVLTVPTENCEEASLIALERALDDLEERMGSNMEKWQWGRLHRTIYEHNPFNEVIALRPIFQRLIANGGGTYTVNTAPYRFSQPYEQYYVPSYRQLVDISDWNESLFVHTTGQSGNVLSKHYDNLIERHQAVEYLPMSFGRGAVSGDVLLLLPTQVEQ